MLVVIVVALAVASQQASPVAPDRSRSATTLDRDGDGRTDPVSWNPSEGQWRIGPHRASLGPPHAVAVPADWDDDGLVDAATWDPSTGTWILPGRPEITFGAPGDIPVPCDWDGDGHLDPGLWRPSDGGWYRSAANGRHLGARTDQAVPGWWHHSGRCTEAVFRDRDGSWPGTGRATPFGLPGDIAIPADWDGDGTTDRAVWRPSTGAWLVDGRGAGAVAYLGRDGDLPVPADWDGDGTIDPAVWRPSNGQWILPPGVRARPTPPGYVALVAPPATRAAVLSPDPPADGSRRLVAEPLSSAHRVAAVAVIALAATTWTAWPLLRARRRPADPDGDAALGPDEPRLLRWLLYATALAMPMNGLRVGPASIANVALAALLVAVLAWRHRGAGASDWPRRELQAVTVGAGLFLAGCLLAEIVAPSAATSPAMVARVAVGVAAPLAAFTLVPWRVQVLTDAAVSFAAGAAISSLAGPGALAHDGRWMGLATHPNHLGLVCLLGIAAAVGAAGTHRWRRLAWVLVAVNLIGLVQSGSRSALLGLVVLAASGAWVSWLARRPGAPGRSRRPAAARWAVAAGGLAAAIWVIARGPGWDRLGGDGASDRARWFRLQLAIERIGRHPISGEGLAFIEEAHSVPFQLAAAGGVLALAGGVLVLALPLLAARRVLAHRVVRWLCCGWLAYLAGATVQNIVVDRYLWSYAGLAIATAHRIRWGKRCDRTPSLAPPDGPADVASGTMAPAMVTANGT